MCSIKIALTSKFFIGSFHNAMYFALFLHTDNTRTPGLDFSPRDLCKNFSITLKKWTAIGL